MTYRNPALLAKMVTTLDIISKGRAILGIGAAWYEPEHDGFGFEFPGAGERLDRLEEAVQICRAMFRDEQPTFDGPLLLDRATRATCRAPIQPGGPPIMIGGSGETPHACGSSRSTPTCATSAAGRRRSRHKLDVLRTHCADVGRDPSEITTTRLGTLVLTPDADETARVRRSSSAGWRATSSTSSSSSASPTTSCARSATLIAAGIDCLIFNMPLSRRPTRSHSAGEAPHLEVLLASRRRDPDTRRTARLRAPTPSC